MSSATSRPENTASRPANPGRPARHRRVLIALAAGVVAIAATVAGVLFLGHGGRTENPLPMAEAMLAKGDYRGAQIALKAALQENPNDPRARDRLGYTLYKLEQFADAEKELRQALALDANNARARLVLARVLLRLGQADTLLAQLQATADMPAPTRAAILALRARALLASGRAAEAEQALSEAEASAPEHPDVLATRAQMLFGAGSRDEALRRIDQAIEQNPGLAELWIIKAGMLRLLDRPPEALAAYAMAIRLEPQSLSPRLATIPLLLAGDRLDQAGAEIDKARRIAPGHPIPLYHEALLELRHGRHAAAQDKLLQVLKAAPDYLPAQLLAGALSLMTGNRETAINHLTRVLERAPDHAHARKLLAAAMLETGQVDRARELIGQLGEDDIGDPLLASLRGDIALRGGNLAEARKQLALAASQAADQPRLLTQLAGKLLGGGDETGARLALEKAASLDEADATPALMLVTLHLRAKRYDQAMLALDRIAKDQPGAALVPNLRGVVEMARGHGEPARRLFEAALRLDPDYLPAMDNLARLELADNNIQAARQRYEALLKRAPDNGKAWTTLAELDLVENNEPRFLSHIGQAKRATPKEPTPRVLATRYWLQRRDADKALAEARAGLDATGSPQFHDLLGAAHMLRGDHAQAIAAYRKWLAAAPRNARAHLQLALAQHAAGDGGAAMTALDQALEIDPDQGEAILAKVRLLIETGQFPPALRLAQDFQARHARAPLAAEAMAWVHAAQGQHGEAARQWENAARLSGHGRYAVMALRAHASAGRVAAGEAYATAWLDVHPKDIEVRHALAQGKLHRGQLQEAANQYTSLLRHAPRDVVALNNLATVYGQLKDKRAVATAEAAWRLAPGNPSVLDTYGWQLSEAGQARQGLPHLRQALAAQPDDPEIRWHLAATLWRAGDKTGAANELDRLLASRAAFPQQAEARELLDALRSARP